MRLNIFKEEEICVEIKDELKKTESFELIETVDNLTPPELEKLYNRVFEDNIVYSCNVTRTYNKYR